MAFRSTVFTPYQMNPSRPTPMPYWIAFPPGSTKVKVGIQRLDNDGSGHLTAAIIYETATQVGPGFIAIVALGWL
jgi:hypothetical protein